MKLPRHPQVHEEWGQCATCGSDVPVSKLVFDSKYNWMCLGPPGAGCFDPRPDREDHLRWRRFRLNEGGRCSKSPLTNTLTEGVDDTAPEGRTGWGYSPYGTSPYGQPGPVPEGSYGEDEYGEGPFGG